jgi:signal transduction histidine kinase
MTHASENTNEQRQVEEPLREEVERLIEADRRKDRFLSVLGHELRNPVAAISMASETLSRLCGDKPDMKTMIDIIARQSHDISRMLDDVLDVSRISQGKIQLHKQRINLVDALQRVVAERQAVFASHNLHVHLELPAQPLWIVADPIRLGRALGNLIKNAIKFTNPGDQVFVTARVLDDAQQACVEVRDTGIGIEPEALTAIFEPFHQGDRKLGRRGGIGLGLALTKGWIELHGGSVEAQSEGPSKGACFRVMLPLANESPAEANTDPAPAQHHRALRILIIEDSADVVASLEFLLRQSGHELAIASDGQQGIAAARQLTPDVVLCDIGLPDMDGYSVARQLRANPATRSIYLIAVSG